MRTPDTDALAAARACLTLESFLVPERMVPSGWHEHAPFAFWLAAALEPRTFVELGTHFGYSYGVFCQAVQTLRLPTRCFAIDTWQGDEHAGHYGPQVFAALRTYHEPRYASFSRLVRSTFAEALVQFADGSVDLLHIDGRHLYEDVREDFETWRAKLAPDAIVLFHDTQVMDRGFGVFRFWQEIAPPSPHFEFTHGNGLGVLAVGAVPPGLAPLFAAGRDEARADAVRTVYARLGGALADRWDLLKLQAAQPPAAR
jgi:hypothetical protein